MLNRYPQQAVLRDGRRVLIRPFTERDTDALYEFFRGLPEGPFQELPPAPPQLGIPGFGPLVRVAGVPPPNATLPIGRVIAREPDIGSEIPVEREGAKIVLLPNGEPLEVRSAPDDPFAHVRLVVESACAGDFRVREVRVSYDV